MHVTWHVTSTLARTPLLGRSFTKRQFQLTRNRNTARNPHGGCCLVHAPSPSRCATAPIIGQESNAQRQSNHMIMPATERDIHVLKGRI
jgi:hypothetical protein